MTATRAKLIYFRKLLFRPYSSHTIPAPPPRHITHTPQPWHISHSKHATAPIKQTTDYSQKIKFLSNQPATPLKQSQTKKTNGKSKNPTFVVAPSKRTIRQERERERYGTQKCNPYVCEDELYACYKRHLEALAKVFERN